MEKEIRQYLDRCLKWRAYKVGFYVQAGHFAAVKNIISTQIKPDVKEDFTISDLRSNKKIEMSCNKNASEFCVYSVDAETEYKPNLVMFDADLAQEELEAILQTAENYTLANGKQIEVKYLPLKID